MNITILAAHHLTDRLFSPASLDKLKSMGDLCINRDDTDPTPERAAELLESADIAVTSWGCPAFDEALLARAPRLKLVLHAAGSVQSIVTQAFWDRGLRITSSAMPLGQGVAETALGMTIASMKNFFAASRDIAQGGWSDGVKNTRELFDVTVGVVGAGCAGAHYLKLLEPFLVEKLVYDPFIEAKDAQERLGARSVSLTELLRCSDVVSIHAPDKASTRHMFNRETLAMMKDGAILLNTARGALIDEDALYEVMRAGKLKYACLDVTDPEPPRADHPLRSLPNVIFTPHIAGLANNGQRRIGYHVAQELARYLKHQPMAAEIKAEQMKNMA